MIGDNNTETGSNTDILDGFRMVIMCTNMAKKYPKLNNPFDNIQQKFDSNL